MKHIILRRFAYSPHGTFGVLYVHNVLNDMQSEEVFRCYTVENPWLLNERNVSCIPEGTYDVSLDYFDKGGYSTFQVESVEDRSEILFHVGNTMRDVEGCIALGTRLGWLDGLWGVGASKTAFRKFMIAMRAEGKPSDKGVVRYDRGKLYVEFTRNIAQRK